MLSFSPSRVYTKLVGAGVLVALITASVVYHKARVYAFEKQVRQAAIDENDKKWRDEQAKVEAAFRAEMQRRIDAVVKAREKDREVIEALRSENERLESTLAKKPATTFWDAETWELIRK